MKRFVTFLDNKEKMHTFNITFITKILVNKKILVYMKDKFVVQQFPVNQYNYNTLTELGIKRQTIGGQI